MVTIPASQSGQNVTLDDNDSNGEWRLTAGGVTMNVTVMKYVPLVLVLFAVAACSSRGSAQPIPSGPLAPDSIICGSDLSQGPGPFINNQLPKATPALVTLVQNWERAWSARNGADDTAAQATRHSDADAITAWCASNDFD